MHFKLTIRLLFLFVILLVGHSNKVNAQTFDEARKFAFNGEREKAKQICREILAEDFNSDVALLLGRVFAWDGMYDSARVVFNQVLINRPENMEVLSAFADVEYWSENYRKAVEYCDMALQKDSLAEDFLLKKARILNSYEQYEEAVNVLEVYNKQHPGSTEVVRKLKEYRLDLMKNRIKIAYTIDVFDDNFNRDPWQITALSYGRTTKIGSVIARLNYANDLEIPAFNMKWMHIPALAKIIMRM